MASDERPIRRVRADWTETVLVCRKCTRKLDGGFGKDGTAKLAKLLRKELNGKAKGRKARVGVVEVGCLDVCPKQAVTVVRAATPGEWAVVPAGTPVRRVIEHLGLGGKPDEAAPQAGGR
jgi:predicted metal-binding protein